MKRPPLPHPIFGVMIYFIFASGSLHAQNWREWKVKTGDDPSYASPQFNDSNWPSYSQWKNTEEGAGFKGNLWLRGPLVFGEPGRGVNYALAVLALGSSEVYLDGQLIAANGLPGSDKQTEEPGKTLFVAAIPPELHTQGEHVLAIKFSNYHGKYHFGIIAIGYGKLSEILNAIRTMMHPLAFTSAFFMVAIYFLLLYLFSIRETAFVLFSVLCALVGALYLVESWRLVGYPYNHHYTRLLLVAILAGIVNLLLPLFFVQMHHLSRKYAILPPLLMTVLGFAFGSDPDDVSHGFFLSGVTSALILSGRALWLRKPHAFWGFLGSFIAMVTLIGSGRDFMEGPFFYCFFLLILLMMTSLSLQIREARRKYQEARLTTARLETELLKKHIQPHFMLNTLTAAMEWVERDPPSAVRFISALATEMRSLFTASGRSLISLSEEVQMCRAHLETQSFRTGQKHELVVSGDIEGIEIPPAVFLTLLENGLTHGQIDATYRFKLDVAEQGRRFSFEANHQEAGNEIVEGAGLRYIKARLEESYPGEWRLYYSLDKGVWRTVITLEKY